jgi:ketosteroid isomerase-like protein
MPPQGGPAAGVADLVALEEAWARAIVANDADLVGSFMTEDWVMVSASGTTSREEFLSAVRSGDLVHSAFDIVAGPRVRTYADTAVVIMRATNTASFQGRRVDADEWTTDVFVRRADRWLCAASHITEAAAPDAGKRRSPAGPTRHG